MKKVWKKAVSMTLALAMLVGLMSGLTINAAAAGSGAEVSELKTESGVTLKPQDASGKAISASGGVYAGVEKFALSFTGTANAQHVVFLLNGENNNKPTENNIRYIDQKAAASNGKVEMTIYPDALPAGQYAVYASAASGFTKLATFVVEASYIVGDVNGDGEVDLADRMVLSRYLAEWDGYAEMIVSMEAADVNGDGEVDLADRMVLSRYLAEWDGYDQYFN